MPRYIWLPLFSTCSRAFFPSGPFHTRMKCSKSFITYGALKKKYCGAETSRGRPPVACISTFPSLHHVLMSSSLPAPAWACTAILPPLSFSTISLNFSPASTRMWPLLKGLASRIVLSAAAANPHPRIIPVTAIHAARRNIRDVFIPASFRFLFLDLFHQSPVELVVRLH